MPALYVYVDGSDLAEVETNLMQRFTQFSRDWGVPTVRVVNDKYPHTDDLKEDDLPQWNLGLNFDVEQLPREKIESLVLFLQMAAKETQREFAIGVKGEDWCFVGQESPQNSVEFLAEQLT